MIQEPTQYAATKQTGTVNRFVVSFSDGTSTWLIGNFEGIWDDGHIYCLTNDYDLQGTSLDLFNNTSSIATLNVKISNRPYKQSDSGWLRLSDEIGDIMNSPNQVVYLYLTADENTKNLSDCLRRFTGRVSSIEHDNETIQITAESKAYIYNTKILTKQIKDTY